MIRAAVGFALLAGCRADPGDPAYPVYQPYVGDDGGFLAGPYPYVDGDDRLALGAFYEGDASEVIAIDDAVNHYYIFSNTYTQAPSEDRVEGLSSDVVTVSGAELWWGGGIVWDNPVDLSGWTTMHVSFRATDPSYEAMALALTGGGTEGRVSPSAYGFAADGEWHSLVIPLAAFSGPALTAVTNPVSFVADVGVPDSTLAIDDLYLTKE